MLENPNKSLHRHADISTFYAEIGNIVSQISLLYVRSFSDKNIRRSRQIFARERERATRRKITEKEDAALNFVSKNWNRNVIGILVSSLRNISYRVENCRKKSPSSKNSVGNIAFCPYILRRKICLTKKAKKNTFHPCRCVVCVREQNSITSSYPEMEKLFALDVKNTSDPRKLVPRDATNSFSVFSVSSHPRATRKNHGRSEESVSRRTVVSFEPRDNNCYLAVAYGSIDSPAIAPIETSTDVTAVTVPH